MIDATHKLGWIPNPEGDYPKARHVLGSRFGRMGQLPLLQKPNLLPFRSGTYRQGPVSSCTAFDLKRRLQLFFASNTAQPAPEIAALDLYYKARAEEWAGIVEPEDRPTLIDRGAIPYYLLRAVEAQGFALERDYPYSIDPTRVAAEPPASLYTKSYSQRGMRWGEIDEVAYSRHDRAVECLRHRCPVGFGIMVDERFLENKGERITSIERGELVGGHMLTVLAILDAELIAQLGDEFPHKPEPGDVLVDNWWDGWGTRSGFGVLSAGVFGSSYVSDVSMIEAVPPMLNRGEP